MLRKSILIVLIGLTAVSAARWLMGNLQPAQAAAPSDTQVYYDGASGSTPDPQIMPYGAVDLEFPFFVEATQTYSPALQATILDTTPDMSDFAGYAVTPTLVPPLIRQAGFTLHVSLQMAAETHTNNDRAGFNLTVISQDLLGIEIAFWEDEIWAQEGGDPPDLFTHAEFVAYDTTAAMTDYDLEFIGSIYRLSANGVQILTGPLRDYTAWEPPFPGIPDPYEQPNLIALSDNTSSAAAETWLSYVALTTPPVPVADLQPATLAISETAGTAVLDVQLSFTSTLAVTVSYGTVDGTAQAGVDYLPVSGNLYFTPGITRQQVTIPILDNDIDEPNRDFQLQLSDPINAQLGQGSATIIILDDDGLPPDYFIYLPFMRHP